MNEEKEAEYIAVVITEIETLRDSRRRMDWELRHHFNEALNRLRVLESQLRQKATNTKAP